MSVVRILWQSVVGATFFGLAACATPQETGSGAGQEDAGLVNLSRADVMAHISGNTETWTKGGGYYAPDGQLHVLWEGKQSVGTWEVNDDGNVCYVVDFWGPDKECHSYVEKGGVVKLQYKDQARVAMVQPGNQLDAL